MLLRESPGLGLPVEFKYSVQGSLFLISDLHHFPKINLNCVLKHIVSLYSLFWMREVAFKSCPWPRKSLGLTQEESAGAGAPLSLWRCCGHRGHS